MPLKNKLKKTCLILGVTIFTMGAVFAVAKFVLIKKEPTYFLPVSLTEEQRKQLEDRKAKNFEMLELFPKNYEVYMDLGNLERELGNASLAIKHFTKAWEIIPTNSTPWLNIGNIYIDLGMYQAAEESFLKAIDVNSRYWFTYYNLAKLYNNFLKEKASQVRGIYLEGLKNTNNDYQLLHFFTDYLVEVSNYTEALQYLEALLSQTPAAEQQPVLERIEYVKSLLN